MEILKHDIGSTCAWQASSLPMQKPSCTCSVYPISPCSRLLYTCYQSKMQNLVITSDYLLLAFILFKILCRIFRYPIFGTGLLLFLLLALLPHSFIKIKVPPLRTPYGLPSWPQGNFDFSWTPDISRCCSRNNCLLLLPWNFTFLFFAFSLFSLSIMTSCQNTMTSVALSSRQATLLGIWSFPDHCSDESIYPV